ncbi:hypothetical protein, partial [Amycolatopsis sp.]|uniref:hypothetical protein n=1 Tax=Amycolatopsis sp. TaxID=37632 RepID=UPI002D7E9769
MRWFSRKNSASQNVTPRGAAAFHYVLAVGDTESDRMVSGELLSGLVDATKKPALQALDLRFGTELWCSEITTNASRQGPCIYFGFDIIVQPGETPTSMAQLVSEEFRA